MRRNRHENQATGSRTTTTAHMAMSHLIPESDTTNQIDRLLISCRRLCVDNHLNQTLHNSILETASNGDNGVIRGGVNGSRLTNIQSTTTSSSSSSSPTNATCNKPIGLDARIKEFYGSIPVLVHDSMSANPRAMHRFMSSVYGKNVKICQPDCLIAYRESSIVQLKERYMCHKHTF